MTARVRILVAVVIVAGAGLTAWWWTTRGRESTDDAQVDAHITPVAARVGGTVLRVRVADNQAVDEGAVLVELDPGDYQIALERARAELATAEAEATAASANVPITATTSSSGLRSAQGGVDQSVAAIEEAQHNVEASEARLASMQARLVGDEAEAVRDEKNGERLKGLLAKDEVSQQQYDAAVAAGGIVQGRPWPMTRAQVREAELAVQVARSRAGQARVGAAAGGCRSADRQDRAEQVTATRARALSAAARVKQAQVRGGARRARPRTHDGAGARDGHRQPEVAEPGQVVQPGQPLMALVPLDQVWVTANFKETQLEGMRVGQLVSVEVDAYGGRRFTGKVESIAAATGSRFSLLPPENASGNFVKVVQRVPVKIVLDGTQDPEHLLRPGMSVTPTVFTR